MAVFLGCTSTGRMGLCFLWFFVQELLEAQPVVVLVLKRLRRRGKWLEWLEVSSDRLGELGIDDTFKRFRLSMHFLTIKYLRIYKYYDVILFSEKEESTSILLKFLLFIICKYNLILYKYISFHDSMKNK